MCALTGRVFEPVGFMKRELEVYAQLGVEAGADDQPFLNGHVP